MRIIEQFVLSSVGNFGCIFRSVMWSSNQQHRPPKHVAQKWNCEFQQVVHLKGKDRMLETRFRSYEFLIPTHLLRLSMVVRHVMIKIRGFWEAVVHCDQSRIASKLLVSKSNRVSKIPKTPRFLMCFRRQGGTHMHTWTERMERSKIDWRSWKVYNRCAHTI